MNVNIASRFSSTSITTSLFGAALHVDSDRSHVDMTRLNVCRIAAFGISDASLSFSWISKMLPVRFSSSFVNVRQITEENKDAKITPPTRQIYDIELKLGNGSLSKERALLDRRRSNGMAMAIIRGGVNGKYEPQHGEVFRPLSSFLADQFDAVSNSRLPFTDEDRAEYLQLHTLHHDILAAPGVREVSASEARNLRFDNVMEADLDEVVSVVGSPDLALRSGGIANCIAVGVIAKTATNVTVRVLAHFSGNGTPEQCLQGVVDRAIGLGAMPGTVGIYLAGGEMAPSESNDANRLEDEEEFLSLRNKFPIVAARMHETRVDCNSDGDTIGRFTDDRHDAAINVVLTDHEMLFSHGNL